MLSRSLRVLSARSVRYAAPRRLAASAAAAKSAPLPGAGSLTLFSVAQEFKILTVSGIALVAAIPAALVAPGVADLLIAVAVPAHSYIGLKHITHDYLPFNADLLCLIISVVIFLGLLNMIRAGGGIVRGVLGSLWID